MSSRGATLALVALPLQSIPVGVPLSSILFSSVEVCVSMVDVASGQVTTVLKQEQLVQDDCAPFDIAIDSHDDIVASYHSGHVATFSAQGQLLSVFDYVCELWPVNVRFRRAASLRFSSGPTT
eukprot:TRINITY_DN7591_c0_g1_i2.p1 TRINITY_DN7591_c0_g1~~TRINITY_DN7591_c0_g1_i2.p1  ORF type:complete len:123 (+),score=2.78 TRINITY_DN7591_c0_g1_i2:23-391(+)